MRNATVVYPNYFKRKAKTMSTHENFDVLLTYPAEDLRIFESMIPLGIASIAAVLEENRYTVKVVDFNHYTGDFRRDLKRWNPKIIGIGGTTPTRKGSFLTAKIAKEVLPHVPVVYGGVHATFTVQDTFENIPQIDFIVKGEGEYAFLRLCEKFVRNSAVDIFSADGICYRSGNGIAENRHARIHDLDALPMPARHIFDYSYAMTLDCNNSRADFIMTSRGCPAACSFCSASRMFPGGVRLRSMREVKREIECILSHKKIEALKLFDSTFTANRQHVVDFCAMIRPYNLVWECEIRADTVDKDLLALMKNSGCCSINVGLETTSERLLKTMGKKIAVGQVEAVLAWCRSLGIKTKVFFTFGHQGQTYDECVKDIEYIRSRRSFIDFYATTIGLRVYPGTQLEKQLRKDATIPACFSWAHYKPPKRNLLLCETSDVLILEQGRLNTFHLSTLIVRLCIQGTVLSAGYIKKMVWHNIAGTGRALRSQFRYTRQRLARILLAVSP